MITPSLSFQRKVINMALNTSRDKEVLMEVSRILSTPFVSVTSSAFVDST